MEAKVAYGIWLSAIYMAFPCIYVIVGREPCLRLPKLAETKF
jgi:hypothetical protein